MFLFTLFMLPNKCHKDIEQTGDQTLATLYGCKPGNDLNFEGASTPRRLLRKALKRPIFIVLGSVFQVFFMLFILTRPSFFYRFS